MWSYDLSTVSFAPRKNALPIPSVSIGSAPLNSVGINQQWASHISGMISVLLETDSWLGTESEIENAINELAVWIEGWN
jgi:hypothetical protein